MNEAGRAAMQAHRSTTPYDAAVPEEAILARIERLRVAGAAALRRIDAGRLERAFIGAVEAFRDPASEERQGLDPHLLGAIATSQPCLDSSLAVLLDGFSPAAVRAVVNRGRSIAAAPPARAEAAPHLLVLAANLPGVVLQPLLHSLALGRPVLVKSATREPFFASAFAAALAAREPLLADAIGVARWRGGATALEAEVFARVGRVVAYGGHAALDDLRRRAGAKLVAFGPKASFAVVSGPCGGDDLVRVARELARDTALFEQRGCLSLQAIYTDLEGQTLGAALVAALEEAAERWPPPAVEAEHRAALRIVREEAAFLGRLVEPAAHGGAGDASGLSHDRAIVIIDPRLIFEPSPGHRTVRIHPLPSVACLPDVLRPHRALLQGAALHGERALALREPLLALGVSYVCAPGGLQSPEASWANSGIDLLVELSG